MRLAPQKITWFGILMAAAACPNPASAQALLRYKFQVGEKLNYQFEQKMAMKMDVAGQPATVEMTQTMDLLWQVTAVDKDGNAKLIQKIDNVRMVMDLPNLGKVEYDSRQGKEVAGPIGQALNPILKTLSGAEFTMDMDAQGKRSNVQVSAALLDQLKKTPGIGAMGGDMFSEEGLKRMMGQGGLVLPRGPVSRGTNWNEKTEVKMPFGTMKVDTKYTFEGPVTRQGKELQQISLKPVITMDPGQGGPFSMKLKDQDAKGKAYFDNAAGRLVETNLKQDMNMETTVGGMTINQKIEQTMTMKLQGGSK
jgi:hypothetical protein